MPAIDRTDDLLVREPRQQRTREQWARILDAGVELLEREGYDGFTIAALCVMADVPPRALYARAATKDALFLAVYERGMAQVLASHEAFRDKSLWNLDDDHARVEQAVRYLVQTFADNEAFLRAVVLVSGAHPEVRRRGEEYVGRLRELFAAVLEPLAVTSSERAVDLDFSFSLVFSALVVRTAYGSAFGMRGDTGAWVAELVSMAQRYLLPAPASQPTGRRGVDPGEVPRPPT